VLRVFVAIETPEAICLRLAAQVEQLKRRIPTGVVRWLGLEGIHLTLKFLGDVSPGKIDQIVMLLERIARHYKPFEVDVGDLGCFPNTHRPRVLWIGVQDRSGTLIDLQKSLEDGFESIGFKREARSFHPHLTFGRIKRRADRSAVQSLSKILEGERIGNIGCFQVNEIYLIRSDLKPTGAIYTKLATIRLESRL
jgi:2'-5' RNA ligase